VEVYQNLRLNLWVFNVSGLKFNVEQPGTHHARHEEPFKLSWPGEARDEQPRGISLTSGIEVNKQASWLFAIGILAWYQALLIKFYFL